MKSKKISEVKNSMNRKRKVTKVKTAKSILLLEKPDRKVLSEIFQKNIIGRTLLPEKQESAFFYRRKIV